MKKIRGDILFRVLFSIAFWFFWMGLPILNAIFDGDQGRYDWNIKILPLNLLAIPIFYLNAEFLTRRYLLKSKFSHYFIGIVLVFLVYLFSYVYVKDYLIDSFPIRVYDSRTLFPVLFVTGLSTLYGLLMLLIDQRHRSEEAKEERFRSELSFLRSQISPHFIFNILNSIVYLIRIKSPNAEKVTIELSKLIRYMLYESENKQVLLEKEIEYLTNYIGLQKVRFGEDVDIITDVNCASSGLAIEPMLLIPFVENAFKHGIGYIKDPYIKINLDIQSGNIMVFRISNKVNPDNRDEPKDADSGIGIKNVRRRIELLYPGVHTLELKEENGVFDVYLELKLKAAE